MATGKQVGTRLGSWAGTDREHADRAWDRGQTSAMISPQTIDNAADRVAKGLAWFSIALGVTEVVAADALAEWLGIEDQSWLLRLLGLREIGHGAGIMMQDTPRARGIAVWARVGGDALDIAALAPALSAKNKKRGNALAAVLTVTGVTALDVFAAWRLAGPGRR